MAIANKTVDISVIETSSRGFRRPKRAQKMLDVYYDEMRPILLVLRLIARLPYRISSDGRMKIGIVSTWSFYTAALYLVQSYLTVENTLELIGYLGQPERTLEELLFSLITLAINAFQCTIVFICWYEWPAMIRYFEQWRQYQKLYLMYLGKPLVGSIKRLIMLSLMVSIPIILILAYLNYAALLKSKWHYMIPFLTNFLHFNVIWMFWMLGCLEMSNISCRIRTQLQEVLGERERRAVKIWQYRRLWLGLSELCRSLGDTLAFTVIYLFLASSTAIVISTYVIVSWLMGTAQMFYPLFFLFITSSAFILSLCEASYRTTKLMSVDFYSEVFKCDTTNFDSRSAHEIDVFLQTIRMNQPNMMLAGYFTINRSLCVSLTSNIVTYLIVLLQFKAAEK